MNSLIDREELLTAGATIATVEARHASYLNLLNDESPFPDPFDDPLSPGEVLDAAGGFIVECESAPFTTAPRLRAVRGYSPTRLVCIRVTPAAIGIGRIGE